MFMLMTALFGVLTTTFLGETGLLTATTLPLLNVCCFGTV